MASARSGGAGRLKQDGDVCYAAYDQAPVRANRPRVTPYASGLDERGDRDERDGVRGEWDQSGVQLDHVLVLEHVLVADALAGELAARAPEHRVAHLPLAEVGDVGLQAAGDLPFQPAHLLPDGRTQHLAPGLGANNQQYAVSRDGRFLINQPVEESTTAPITLILNWHPGLSARENR